MARLESPGQVVDRSSLVVEDHMEACPESRVLGHTDQEVGQTHGHIVVVGDSSHRIVVVEDILEGKRATGRDEMGGLAVKEEVRVEMSSDAKRVSARSITRYGKANTIASTIRRKATEISTCILRIRNRSVINIRNISS